MNRPVTILFVMAVVLAAGIVLSVYASMVVFEDIVVIESEITRAEPLRISTDIPPGTGIMAVSVADYTNDMRLGVQVLGPLGLSMRSDTISEASFEDTFTVQESSEYVLIVESDHTDPIRITAALGSEPDAFKTSLGFVSLYLSLVGMAGMIISTIYLMWRRRRSSLGSYPSR